MKKIQFLHFVYILFISTMLQGCLYLNERGISDRRYDDCVEYYDSVGFYHKECDKNIVDYEDISPSKLLQTVPQ